jgi:hypothetical protein
MLNQTPEHLYVREGHIESLIRSLRSNRGDEVFEVLRDFLAVAELPDLMLVQIGHYLTRTVLPDFFYVPTTCSTSIHKPATLEFIHQQTGVVFCLVPGRRESICHECEGRGFFTSGDLCLFCDGTGRLEAFEPFLVAKSQIAHEIYYELSDKHLTPVVNVPVECMQEWAGSFGWNIPAYRTWLHFVFGSKPRRYFWGNSLRPSYVWYAKNSKNAIQSITLHSCKPNVFGLIDVVGNAWELLYRNGWVACGGSFATEVKYLNAWRTYDVEFDTKSPELSFRPCRPLF